MHQLTTTTGIIAIAAGVVAIVALLLSAGLALKLRRVRLEQRVILGDGHRDLIGQAAELQTEFEALHRYVEDLAGSLEQRVEAAESRFDGAISHRALVRYDAYGEMSGRRSTSIALLDASASGVVLSSIHHRDQARVYAQEIAGRDPGTRAIARGGPGGRSRAGAHPAPISDRLVPRAQGGAMRTGYLGPEGTFTQEALLASARDGGLELVALPTIYDTVMAVHEGSVERALVPIENSLEGSVNATLDALAMETDDVAIVGEVVHPIRHCLIARAPLELVADRDSCVASSGDRAVRAIPARPPARCSGARGELHGRRRPHGCRARGPLGGPGQSVGGRALPLPNPALRRRGPPRQRDPLRVARSAWWRPRTPGGEEHPLGPWKTAIVFWGLGAEAPGWLVSCLSEFSQREVNLTRIESRPRKQGLGRYMFFVDLEGAEDQPSVAEALAALKAHVEELRVLGSFPAFTGD